MTIIKTINSNYDGDANLRGNGALIEHGGQIFRAQWFDAGLRLSVEDGNWWIAYRYNEIDPVIVWRCEGADLDEVRRDATTAELEMAAMARSGELAKYATTPPTADLADFTPWQKGDDQAD